MQGNVRNNVMSSIHVRQKSKNTCCICKKDNPFIYYQLKVSSCRGNNEARSTRPVVRNRLLED